MIASAWLMSAAEFLGNFLIHSTVAVTLGWGIIRCCRRALSPERRVLVWKAALVVPVATTFAVTATGLRHVGVEFSVGFAAVDRLAAADETAADGIPFVTERTGDLDVLLDHDRYPEDLSSSGTADLSPDPPTPPASTWFPVSSVFSWWLAMIGWVAGGFMGIVVLITQLRRLEKMRRSAACVTGGELYSAMNRLLQRFGVRRAVDLRIASNLPGPLTAGIRKPFLPLPNEMSPLHGSHDDLSGDEWDALLAHELAHIALGAATWNLIAQLIRRVFFIQPLTTFAARQLQKEMDVVADAHAARELGHRGGLANCLMRLGAAMVARRVPAVDWHSLRVSRHSDPHLDSVSRRCCMRAMN